MGESMLVVSPPRQLVGVLDGLELLWVRSIPSQRSGEGRGGKAEEDECTVAQLHLDSGI